MKAKQGGSEGLGGDGWVTPSNPTFLVSKLGAITDLLVPFEDLHIKSWCRAWNLVKDSGNISDPRCFRDPPKTRIGMDKSLC